MEREPLADRPSPVPEGILKTLMNDEAVEACLQDTNQSAAGSAPAAWFVGSVVHLDGGHERDMIILPKKSCLLGAYIAPFWIFRKQPGGYSLVLNVSTGSLELLSSKTSGLRDIRTTSGSAAGVGVDLYKFDGTRYVAFKKSFKKS
jgi:hypothetical protein